MKEFNVNALYIYKFISQCLPIYAFYTILFMKRGQTVTDIAILIAVWSLFTIVFEIPSGILADRWNRRNMLAIASVLQGLCFIIWFFSHTLLMFTVGFIFWAVAVAFTSGTEEGLIYDNLKSDKCEESFTRVYGKAQFYANAGTIIGIASAGIMASFVSVEIIALISAAVCFSNIIFVLQIREKNYYSEQLDRETTVFFDTFKKAGAFIKGSQTALISILFLVIFASIGSYLDEFDALIINDFKLSEIWVSIILAVRFVFVAIGSVLAQIVQKKISSFRQIFLLNSAACAFLATFAAIWNQFVIPLFGLSFTIMTITEVLFVHVLQKEIREEGRATVMSFYSAGQNAAMICFSLVFALLANIFTLQQVYIIISFYGIAGGLSVYLLYRTVFSNRS